MSIVSFWCLIKCFIVKLSRFFHGLTDEKIIIPMTLLQENFRGIRTRFLMKSKLHFQTIQQIYRIIQIGQFKIPKRPSISAKLQRNPHLIIKTGFSTNSDPRNLRTKRDKGCLIKKKKWIYGSNENELKNFHKFSSDNGHLFMFICSITFLILLVKLVWQLSGSC